MVTQEIADDGDGDRGERRLISTASSAAAFVEGGIQDACDDSCSICLEPFGISDPATVTACKHEYHLQCILEWAQRSKECPMCWQPLSLKDPSSQELLDAVEQEQVWRHFEDGTQIHEASNFANYNDFEERIMEHLTHQLGGRGALQINGVADAHAEQQPAREALLPTVRRRAGFMAQNHRSFQARYGWAERNHIELEPVQEGTERSPSSEIAESLKSRFLVASAKCKETFARTTRNFKERFRSRSDKAADFRLRAQEVSADVVRQALRRITPAADGNEDVPTTSMEPESGRKSLSVPNSSTISSHVEGNGVAEASHQPPS